VLFGSVQITMILISIISGTRLHLSEWGGVVIAFSGFVYLSLPGVAAPSMLGLFLMSVAGIAWGVYTLKGRGSVNPLVDTASNFIRTIPLVVVTLVALRNSYYTLDGLMLAIASGIGYTIWYSALRGLTATQAAVVQLAVPVIAALGGIIFIAEAMTQRLIMSSLMILGGILLVIIGRYYFELPTKR